MWEIIEMAQKAAIEAEVARETCKRLCSQSKEENIRMKQDISKNLEFRIDHERFWVKELEARISAVKESREKLIQAKTRLEKSISTCERGTDVTDRCYRAVTSSESMKSTLRVQLLDEEMKLFEEARTVLVSIIGAIVEIDKSFEDICQVLETDIHNKYVAVNKDQQSLALKLHSPQLPSLIRSSSGVCKCPSTSRMAELETRNEQTLGQADLQVSSCRLFLAQMEEVMSKLTEKLTNHFRKVTNALQERLTELKTGKSDLESHLSLVDAHASNTEESMAQLQKTISEKESAMLLVRGQLQLHFSRPKSEFCVDQVGTTLERELTECKSEWRVLSAQLPVLEKTLRSLRRSRLQILADISEHGRKIEIEELHCLNARAELHAIRL